jgi:GGDEF domain-containing protein
LGEQKQELTVALEQIQLMAAHDDLTGLLNRRHMVVLLEQETQRSLRSGRGFCLALIDMDHFKRVNDRYGHAAGDAVLRAFSDTAQAVLRRSDVLARWGGEEFVLMQSDDRHRRLPEPPWSACASRWRSWNPFWRGPSCRSAFRPG